MGAVRCLEEQLGFGAILVFEGGLVGLIPDIAEPPTLSLEELALTGRASALTGLFTGVKLSLAGDVTALSGLLTGPLLPALTGLLLSRELRKSPQGSTSLTEGLWCVVALSGEALREPLPPWSAP